MTFGSFVRLGYYFVARVLARALPARGLDTFHRNYRDDKLLPLSPEERRALPDFSGCIACGRCDATYYAQGRRGLHASSGPSDLPLAYTRGLPDYPALSGYLRGLASVDLERLEKVCPGRVPLRRLRMFAESQVRALDQAAPIQKMGLGSRREES